MKAPAVPRLSKKTKASVASFLMVLFAFVILGRAYLHPGADLVLTGSTTKVLSDGTDPATLPFSYSVIIDHFWSNPSFLLYGAVPTEQLNPPEGHALWIPWLERWLVPFFSLFLPVEQISTSITWLLMVFNGLAFYLLGRALGWQRPLSLGLGIALAFNSYTRARAKVHIALVGVYHLPLIFLALVLLRNSDSRKNLLLASVLFLLSATVAHYYLVLTIALAPAFLIFFYLSKEVRNQWKKATARLAIAILPALLFLAWNFAQPLPPDFVSSERSAFPQAEPSGESGLHPFMTRFASRPIDYLAGDTAIGKKDWNPLRAMITAKVHNDLDGSNYHERANGVRWTVLALLCLALVFLLRRPTRSQIQDSARSELYYFLLFALLCLLISFKPLWFGLPLGPSGWIHQAIAQFRVPSRAGIFAQFGALMVVGLFLRSWAQTRPALAKALFLFPIIMIIDFPPWMNEMPVTRVLPRASAEESGPKNCGTGLHFPYISGDHETLQYYYFLQQMRGTDCKILNAVSQTQSNDRFLQTIPHQPALTEAMQSNHPGLRRKLVIYARCARLDWIFFDKDAPEPFRRDACRDLGWQRTGPQFCQRLSQGPLNSPDPVKCLKVWR